MRAYISLSYRKKPDLKNQLKIIKDTLIQFKIEPFVFIDTYNFESTQEKHMMIQAMQDIDSSDILIAETSDKGIGIGIEVGYAKAKQKPIVYVRQKNAEHSTTVSGISDYHIIYESDTDLHIQLGKIITLIGSV
jgi:nucleoside 2-deoxyribosyltransferase